MDDDPVTYSNPLISPETFDIGGGPVEETKNAVEETKTERVERVNQPEENALNISNVSNTNTAEDNFVYKKIKNEKILRALLKKIETKPSRKLTDDEKKILKGFYKKNNVTWAANTQSTGGVKNQLHKFKL